MLLWPLAWRWLPGRHAQLFGESDAEKPARRMKTTRIRRSTQPGNDQLQAPEDRRRALEDKVQQPDPKPVPGHRRQ